MRLAAAAGTAVANLPRSPGSIAETGGSAGGELTGQKDDAGLAKVEQLVARTTELESKLIEQLDFFLGRRGEGLVVEDGRFHSSGGFRRAAESKWAGPLLARFGRFWPIVTGISGARRGQCANGVEATRTRGSPRIT